MFLLLLLYSLTLADLFFQANEGEFDAERLAALAFDSEITAAYNGLIMRIGLISDTHVPEVESELPAQVMELFHGVDLILHAGDIFTPSVLDDLERIAPVLAALGDDDYARADKRVKQKHILEIEGQILWLVHMGPLYFDSGEWLRRDSSEQDGDGSPDIIVFGHEHHALVQRSDGILYVNPGSPTLLDYRKGPGTVGILDISSGKADASIVKLQ